MTKLQLAQRNLQLARRANAAGAHYSLRIVLEARRAGIDISLAFAVIAQESNFKNIFGHDRGGLFSSKASYRVTNGRVNELLRSVAAGAASNGVGLPQLTWPPFIRRAVALKGGARLPKNQLRVAFQDLGALVKQFGERGGLAAYNAGSPKSTAGLVYAHQVLTRKEHWHRVLAPTEK